MPAFLNWKIVVLVLLVCLLSDIRCAPLTTTRVEYELNCNESIAAVSPQNCQGCPVNGCKTELLRAGCWKDSDHWYKSCMGELGPCIKIRWEENSDGSYSNSECRARCPGLYTTCAFVPIISTTHTVPTVDRSKSVPPSDVWKWVLLGVLGAIVALVLLAFIVYRGQKVYQNSKNLKPEAPQPEAPQPEELNLSNPLLNDNQPTPERQAPVPDSTQPQTAATDEPLTPAAAVQTVPQRGEDNEAFEDYVTENHPFIRPNPSHPSSRITVDVAEEERYQKNVGLWAEHRVVDDSEAGPSRVSDPATPRQSTSEYRSSDDHSALQSLNQTEDQQVSDGEDDNISLTGERPTELVIHKVPTVRTSVHRVPHQHEVTSEEFNKPSTSASLIPNVEVGVAEATGDNKPSDPINVAEEERHQKNVDLFAEHLVEHIDSSRDVGSTSHSGDGGSGDVGSGDGGLAGGESGDGGSGDGGSGDGGSGDGGSGDGGSGDGGSSDGGSGDGGSGDGGSGGGGSDDGGSGDGGSGDGGSDDGGSGDGGSGDGGSDDGGSGDGGSGDGVLGNDTTQDLANHQPVINPIRAQPAGLDVARKPGEIQRNGDSEEIPTVHIEINSQ